MTAFKKAFLALVMVITVSALAGCESVDSAMQSVKEQFASLDLDMPTITTRDDERTSNQRTASSVGASSEEKKVLFESNKAAKADSTSDSVDESSFSGGTSLAQTSSNCPPVSVIPELDSLYQFDNPDRPTPAGKISSIQISELKTSCKYNPNNVAVEIDISFAGELGPRARVWNTDKPSFAYPYFMAITTPNGNIVAKEVFAATVSYNNGEQTVSHEESLRQIIPLKGVYDEKHSLLIGFQLTEGELAYNRAVKSVPARAFGEKSLPLKEQAKAKPMSITPERKPKNVAVKASATPSVEPAAGAQEPKEREEQVKAQDDLADDTAEKQALAEESAAEETSAPLEQISSELEKASEELNESASENPIEELTQDSALEAVEESAQENKEEVSKVIEEEIKQEVLDTGIVKPQTLDEGVSVEPPPIENPIDDHAAKEALKNPSLPVEDMIDITAE